MKEDEPSLLKRILELVLEFPRYGYRRITHLLRTEGWSVNAKRIYRLWLMLKDNEPYRYAQPTTTQQKLSRLRVAATGHYRKPAHKGRRPGVKNGEPPTRQILSIGQVCEREGLPPAHGFEHLPEGEQKILKDLGVIDYVQEINTERRVSRKRTSRRIKSMPSSKRSGAKCKTSN